MDRQLTNRFWQYYYASLNWKDEFNKIFDGLELNSQLKNEQVLIQQFINQNKFKFMNKRFKNHLNKDKFGQTDQKSGNNLLSIEKILNESEEELNPEFLEFILETRKHQLERDRKKAQLARKEENEIEYRDITELENRHKLIDLKEPQLRLDLYGDQAKEIYLKELKLQFSFNEFCDKYQPNFWPLIPINLNINQ